jgi:hypothetical protein
LPEKESFGIDRMVKILNDAAFGYSKDSWGVPFTEACRWPWQGQEILVALNLVSEPRRFEWNAAGRLLLSTYLDKSDIKVKSPVVLCAGEGVIIKFLNP